MQHPECYSQRSGRKHQQFPEQQNAGYRIRGRPVRARPTIKEPTNCTFPSTMDVSEYTTKYRREEADTSCRNHDSAAVHSNHDSHSNKSAKGKDPTKPINTAVGCEREDSRTINCRFGVRDVFLRDCNECCGDLCDELTNTINKNAHTSRKLQTLQERIDEPDIVSGFLKNNIHMSVYNARRLLRCRTELP